MIKFAPTSKTYVVKTNRETIGLVTVACAMTFALAYAVHSRPVPSVPPVNQEWTGQLADLAVPTTIVKEPLRSADLVVPQSQLALPAMPAKPVVKRGCDEPCPKTPLPPRRDAVKAIAPIHVAAQKDTGFLTTLNPLNHVPDAVTRPFSYAGDVVAGWIKRF